MIDERHKQNWLDVKQKRWGFNGVWALCCLSSFELQEHWK